MANLSLQNQSPTTKMQLNKEFKSVLIALGVLLVCSILVSLLFLEFSRSYYANKSAPRQYIQGYDFSGINSLQAQTYLQTILDNYLTNKVEFNIENETFKISYKDLGVTTDFNPNFKKLKFYSGKPTRKQLLMDQFQFKNTKIKLNLNEQDLIKNLVATIPQIELAKPAAFVWDQLDLTISPEKVGNKTNFSSIRTQLLVHQPIINVTLELENPSVTVADLEPLKKQFLSVIQKPLQLTYLGKNYSLNLGQTPQAVIFSKDNAGLTIELDTQLYTDFLQQTVIPEIEIEPETLKIQLLNDQIVFDGIGKSGQKIKSEQLYAQLTDALNQALLVENPIAIKSIPIPVEEASPILKIDQALQKRGIKELISTSYTTYHGSPPNRIHNITVGAKTYTGLMIKEGQEFSFNDNLGPVDGKAGYLPELVIKSEGTIPEFGGGLCQVSTTVYRTALFAGLDITERYNHSYSVSYYAQVLGEGLDATIYPGIKDLKFVNNTPGDVVMQTFTEGTKITTRFFGTKDTRIVNVEGPKILRRSGAGAPVYNVKPDLPPGTIKQIQSAHAGVVTEWKRKMTMPDGTLREEVIPSNYRSVAPKFLVSSDKAI